MFAVGVKLAPNAYTVPEVVPVLHPPKILLVPPPIVPIVAKVTDPPEVDCVTDETDGDPLAPLVLNVTVYKVTAADVVIELERALVNVVCEESLAVTVAFA
jgi:hypothetical protein